uniref:Uncharacterized protein n=1 Tax=Anguilla anguilla TaxID=7936 RepID=A0A0E9SC73_ANGAN
MSTSPPAHLCHSEKIGYYTSPAVARKQVSVAMPLSA